MNWTEVAITTTTEGIEDVTGIVLMQGIGGVVIEDKADFDAFLAEASVYWDYVDDDLLKEKQGPTRVKCYLPETPEGAEMLALLREALDRVKGDPRLGPLTISLVGVKEEDWENNWKQFFKPLLIDDRLIIRPSWEQVTPVEGQTVVQIDPKMSFGTGTHYTTKLCLQTLSKCITGGERVLDLGCGSGILSIAALKLGAKSAVAVDIDPLAVSTAMENAGENGVAERLWVFSGNIMTDPALITKYPPFDVVAANIVADVIIAIAPLLRQMVKEDGIVITSGIIDSREDEVAEKLSEAGLTVTDILRDGGWSSILLRP